ncbi:hypothetical protein GALMADRAFT_1033618 [Galerina marginata CBS 339.88]|uniref:Uncharacterized protein n=1 Tax=Galerina marginata (strain CBS 339.88) TaxID=685588 RepID=A0A067SCB7_GALM3|nr:hypothetical protein GALMADRAFT_1033618 [Galerina marginata CBS 339.88]
MNANGALANKYILLLIFSLNADIFSVKDALRTTRMSSQACRSWRSILLDTPSLWAKLIDLDVLDQVTDNWRNEVLRRSADCLLWIKGTKRIYNASLWVKGPDDVNRIQYDVSSLQRFFFSVLAAHWSRIERVAVSIEAGCVDSQAWRCIYLPAPRLRDFELEFHDMDTTLVAPIVPLFANHAPLLTTFYAKHVKFDISAPWVPALRSITIGPPTTLSETLDLLETTPLLETLRINEVPTEITNRICSIHLPNLQEMTLSGPFGVCMTLVKSIVVCTQGLPLRLSIEATGSNPGELNPTVLHALSDFWTRYFGVHVPVTVGLEILSQSFCFSGNTSDESDFSFTFPTPSAFSQLLHAFTLSIFHTVSQLKLEIPKSPPARPELIAFLLSLSSVKILHADDRVLQHLQELQKETSQACLPMLKTIKLKDVSSKPEDKILPFVQARKNAGIPIKTFDLTKYSSTLVVGVSLAFLDKMEGLKVVYFRLRVGQARGQGPILIRYVCGSGNPNILRF